MKLVEKPQIAVEFIFCNNHGQLTKSSKKRLRVGSSTKCDVVFPGEKEIRAHHCTLQAEGGRWFVYVQNDSKVWVNNELVKNRRELDHGTLIFLGSKTRPGLRIHLNVQPAARPLHFMPGYLREIREFRSGLLTSALKSSSEKPFQRKVIRRAFTRQKKVYLQRMIRVSGAFIFFLITLGSYLYYQQSRLDRLKNLADEIFYQMKNIKLQVAQVEDIVAATGDSSAIEQSEKLWGQFRLLEKQYDTYLREMGYGDKQIPEDEKLVLRMARMFGESELNVPEGFVSQVRLYIKKWQSTPRLKEAITKAVASGYHETIARSLMKNHLPPHLFYLALQESDFDVNRCGPRTRYGIAKGMWQFIPATAVYFGLKLGPLVEVRKPDPKDERHHFQKSTEAAVKYLRFLYTTEAQASGLLVMASYNWGESKIRNLINRFPENPRERNFWNLMKKYRLPAETRDYVFYIFSAAVIGENPRLFGLDIDPPLASVLN